VLGFADIVDHLTETPEEVEEVGPSDDDQKEQGGEMEQKEGKMEMEMEQTEEKTEQQLPLFLKTPFLRLLHEVYFLFFVDDHTISKSSVGGGSASGGSGGDLDSPISPALTFILLEQMEVDIGAVVGRMQQTKEELERWIEVSKSRNSSKSSKRKGKKKEKKSKKHEEKEQDEEDKGEEEEPRVDVGKQEEEDLDYLQTGSSCCCFCHWFFFVPLILCI